MNYVFLGKGEKEKYLGFNDTWFIYVGIAALGLFIPPAFFNVDILDTPIKSVLYQCIDAAMHASIYWIGIRAFMIFIRNKYEGFQYARLRIILAVIFVIVYGGVVTLLLKLSGYVHEFDFYEPTAQQGFFATYFSSFFVMSIYEGIYFYDQNKRTLITQEELKRNHIHSELQGLRNQVNPHFLFNSMNTLMNIIYEDQNLAASFLKKLSAVYRYILEKRDDHLIPLRDELEFIESYIFLQKERFKNKLHVEIEISDAYLDRYVPPLSLQILFENAIKHNVISQKEPLQIDVYVDMNHHLVVSNNYNPKKQLSASTGVGLENIKSRLSYFTNDLLSIDQKEGFFKVSLPLLLKESELLST